MERKWEQEPQSGTRMGTKWERSDKNPKVGQEWEQSGNKVGTKWGQEPQSGTRTGTKWEQEPQKWEQSGNKNPKVEQE